MNPKFFNKVGNHTTTPLRSASFKRNESMSVFVKVNENKFSKISFEKSDPNLNLTQKRK